MHRIEIKKLNKICKVFGIWSIISQKVFIQSTQIPLHLLKLIMPKCSKRQYHEKFSEVLWEKKVLACYFYVLCLRSGICRNVILPFYKKLKIQLIQKFKKNHNILKKCAVSLNSKTWLYIAYASRKRMFYLAQVTLEQRLSATLLQHLRPT